MRIGQTEIDTCVFRTVVIGSGCAGLNAAASLKALGENSLCIVTDGMDRGTSRNAGSDKQTYYKLSLAGETPDSVYEMAKALISEGVNGDTALCEAAGSAQAFFRLVQLGVDFPTNEYGEFVGYRTDHDNRGRATSAGPLTSRKMTEALEKETLRLGIPVFDGWTAFALLIDAGRAAGVLAYSPAKNRLCLFAASHVIIATGGPAQIYEASVYPLSQQGMTGMAAMAGARLSNLHQWQYGIASTAFRWNLSGSYQQVLPRYVSVDKNGNEHEFLNEAFPEDPMEAVRRTFLKGYQWPFDVRKTDGSSQIDLLVHKENAIGRRVYLDFRRNPFPLADDLSNLDGPAKEYLANTGAVQDTPYKRLMFMNSPAAELYRAHGIDLETEMLEIRVCAQHHNGGIAVDTDWQTSIPGLYAVGECAGTFGAYRPGGSALNSTQVGSLRAAQHIARSSMLEPVQDPELLSAQVENALDGLGFGANCTDIGLLFRREMSLRGAHLRDICALRALDAKLESVLEAAKKPFDSLPDDMEARIRLRDQLVIQRAVISAMVKAAQVYGSTGAGLALDAEGRPLPHAEKSENLVLYTEKSGDGYTTSAEPARPIPKGEQWFENVWKKYRESTRKTDSGNDPM
ncbi:MAG: FAD-binding protein [Clostridiales bacterium]|nr:FAD-binding protein [Clostridiales bacterium]